MKKPDNIVYNNTLEEYDAFKKQYPTSFSAKNFELEEIENLQRQAKPYFSQKFLEIKKKIPTTFNRTRVEPINI